MHFINFYFFNSNSKSIVKKLTFTLFLALFALIALAQYKKDQEIISDSEAAKADF